MSVLIVDDINYRRCTILCRLWPELIPCQGECEILIFTPIQSQPSPLSATRRPARAQAKLQCTNKLEAQGKLRLSCDLMTTELFSHACDTWVIVMRVIVMVITVTRFSFPNKSRKLLVILSRLVSAWSLQSVLGAENEGDNPIEWLKNSIPGKHASDWSGQALWSLSLANTEWELHRWLSSSRALLPSCIK